MNGLFIPRLIRTTSLPARYWIIPLAAVIGLTGFLVFSARTYRTGFPLDDAWIHQTYARNLGLQGTWAFLPGQPSAGSTSPLWSLLLAPGYRLNWMPFIWTFLLGGLSLVGLALAGEQAYRAGRINLTSRVPWMGVFLALEWHLVWAAASGMETVLYAFLVLVAFALLFQPQPRWGVTGGLIGLAVWVRPDGITLLGPAFLILFLCMASWQERAKAYGRLLVAFLVFFLPYLFFNYQLAGSWWPNTFYAKQAEYAILAQFPLAERILSLMMLPLVGAGAVLVPGVLYVLWKSWQKRRYPILAAFLWWSGYTLLYAIRLPVTYQHGRYLIPSMPVFFLLGMLGLSELWHDHLLGQWGKPVKAAWALSGAIVLLIFYGLGANAYAQDVAIIETEMVTTAQWIAQNTPADATIAAHDIGAMGYFGQRRLLDLAGLVTPEVIPFIRDEARLASYLDAQQVSYLVTFPGWYPALVKNGLLVYSSQGRYAPLLGGENMAVYRWRGAP